MGFMAALPAIIGGAGSLFGGLFGGMASGEASGQYVKALQQAQQSLQGSEDRGLQNFQPYLSTGSTAAKSLGSLLGTPGQGLLTPWTGKFTAPTAAQAEATPGYQFQLQQGENAMQNSAAAGGGLLSGRTLASLNNYAQGTASENYQNVFNNALTQYQSGYNTFLNNQNNTYSRLMGASGQGLQAAGGAGSLISGIGGDIASLYGAQGAARAGGTLGQANAYGSIFPGIANAVNGYNLSSLLGNGSIPNATNGPVGFGPTAPGSTTGWGGFPGTPPFTGGTATLPSLAGGQN